MTRPHPHDNAVIQSGANETTASDSSRGVGALPSMGDDMERRMLRAMFACSPDAIIITDPQRRFVMLNPVAERMFGYSEAEVVGRGGALFHADSQRFHELDPRLSGSPARQHIAAPLMLRRKDGSIFTADATRHALNDADGSVAGYLTLVRDVTQQLRDEEERQQVAQALHRSEADLRRLAYHDPLTGLVNRVRLLERLREMMGRQTRESGAFAVLFIDFDRFKMINDTMGHEIGDQLLVSIADRLNKELGEQYPFVDRVSEGLAGRIGGDEFVMLLPDMADVPRIGRFVDHLQRALAQPHDLAGQAVVCTASIGIVMVRGGEYERPEQIVRDADIAMYEAKASGRSRSAWFDQHMRNRILERASLESDMRQALDERLFRLHFQPIFSLETGEATGFEAVIRWPDAKRGMVPPHRFLPIAQEMGLSVPMGRWVLAEACAHWRAWQPRITDRRADAPLTLHVNLFCEQLVADQTVALIAETLRDVDMPASALMLEIPKTVFTRPEAPTMRALRQIQQLGVGLAVDNLGFGSGSMAHLHDLPLRQIKMSASLVHDMANRMEYAALVQATITLAHSLGLTVVAAGIETEAQLTQLQTLNCDLGQGFYFAPALSSEEAAAFTLKPQSLSKSA